MKIRVGGDLIKVHTLENYAAANAYAATDITCVDDTAGSLDGKYLKIHSGNDINKHLFWFNIASQAETSTITAEANVTGVSFAGKYFTIQSADLQNYYVWFSKVGMAQQDTITCVQESSHGGKYFTFYGLDAEEGNETKYYVWLSVGEKQVSTITARADDTGDLNNKYWTFYSLDADNGTETKYGVWYNVNSAGVEPTMSGVDPANAIEVLVDTDATLNDVATASISAINTFSANVVATPSTDDIVLTADYFGAVTAAAVDGDLGGTSSFSNTTSGVDDDTDPAVADATGIKFNVPATTSAGDVAIAMAAAINTADPGVGATVATNDVVLLGDFVGSVTAGATDGDLGFVIVEDYVGRDAVNTDPTPSYSAANAVSVEVALTGGNADDTDTNAEVAALIETAIDALDDFGASATDEVVTITNAATGAAVDIDAGDTGWTVAVTEQGATSTTTAPKIPFYTAHKVDIDAGDLKGAIATALSAVIDAVSDFGASATDEVVTVTNAAYGECTHVTDVNTDFTVNNTTPGSMALPTAFTTVVTYVKITGTITDERSGVPMGATLPITKVVDIGKITEIIPE